MDEYHVRLECGPDVRLEMRAPPGAIMIHGAMSPAEWADVLDSLGLEAAVAGLAGQLVAVPTAQGPYTFKVASGRTPFPFDHVALWLPPGADVRHLRAAARLAGSGQQ
jgi:hypothetical protein